MTGFADRHLGPRADDQAQMLKALEVGSLEELIDLAVPAVIRSEGELDLPDAQSEHEVLATLRELADRNEVLTSLIGLGYSGTVTPPVVLRNVLENPAWYTAYTPYQPEISQGRLEALLNFQTMVSDLTGMDLANASLLDEGTAAAEAMTMCRRVAKVETPRFFVDEACHPQTIDVVSTRAEPLGIEVVTGDPLDGGALAGEWFGALLQYPDTFGRVRDLRPAVQAVHDAGGLVTVATDLLALVLLTPPGEWGADVVVGNSQRFGVPFGFGGPHAAFMATRDSFKRSLPGRLVGVSVDTKGRRALRLALQTREQHIRREKATSNICTNQGLFALRAAVYLALMGPQGMRELGELCLKKSRYAAEQLTRDGRLSLAFSHPTFKEFVVRDRQGDVPELIQRGLDASILAGVPLEPWYPDLADCFLVAVTEKRTRAQIDALASALTQSTKAAAAYA
jgi:glycine dehydrogenase